MTCVGWIDVAYTSVSSAGLFVNVDTDSRPVWHFNIAVDYFWAVGHHFKALRYISIEMLQNQKIRQARHQMHSGHFGNRAE